MMSCWARGQKRLEVGLHFRQIKSHCFGLTHGYTPEEESFLPSEEKFIHACVYMTSILDVHVLLFNLLKEYSRS